MTHPRAMAKKVRCESLLGNDVRRSGARLVRHRTDAPPAIAYNHSQIRKHAMSQQHKLSFHTLAAFDTATPPGAPRWSTTSYGEATDTGPQALTALGEHVSLCRADSSRFSRLQCGALAVHGLVAARFVTTLAVVAALIGAVLLVI